ncbi:MAG: hypothetical protein LKF70_11160 [Prevotella sp.]|jgi:hypothetical protein|nr:hypothetical protein [Prevotella sp.]
MAQKEKWQEMVASLIDMEEKWKKERRSYLIVIDEPINELISKFHCAYGTKKEKLQSYLVEMMTKNETFAEIILGTTKEFLNKKNAIRNNNNIQ